MLLRGLHTCAEVNGLIKEVWITVRDETIRIRLPFELRSAVIMRGFVSCFGFRDGRRPNDEIFPRWLHWGSVSIIHRFRISHRFRTSRSLGKPIIFDQVYALMNGTEYVLILSWISHEAMV